MKTFICPCTAECNMCGFNSELDIICCMEDMNYFKQKDIEEVQEPNIIVDKANAEAVKMFRKWYWDNDTVPVSGGYPVLAIRDALRINDGNFIKTRRYLMDNRMW